MAKKLTKRPTRNRLVPRSINGGAKAPDPGRKMLQTFDEDRRTRARTTKAAATEGDKTSADDEDLNKWWMQKISAANKAYDEWAQYFRVKQLEEYYEGHHWLGLTEQEARQKYVVNLTFATVETQLPSLLFSSPRVKVDAKPDRVQIASSGVSNRATLIQNALQTQVDNRELHFTFITTLALHDAYMRFGVCEVGYEADWIDNPNAEKPALSPDDDTTPLQADGEEVKQPPKVQSAERVYVKRIPAQAYRAWPGRNVLTQNDWVGYYENHNVKDVKANPNYENTAELRGTGKVIGSVDSDDHHIQEHDREISRVHQDDQIKLWKVWDLRKKVRYVLAEGGKRPLQQKKFTTLPHAAMKFFERSDSFYPIPPLWNWLSPQDEINETREMMKVHRRRAVRRYMREPQVRREEWEKLETGEDGTCIEVPKVDPAPIKAIENAELGQLDITGGLAASKDDFTQVTGVGGEARGTPDADTATQANIINIRAQVRENRARKQVADWLGDILRLVLFCIRDNFDLPFMVNQVVDPLSFAPLETAKRAQGWKEIQREDISQLDVDVKIDIASLSPVAEDAERGNWNIVLGLLQNQNLLMLLMQANPDAPNEPPPLLRKTLYLNGIKDDAEVREIFRVGQEVTKSMAMIAMAQAVAAGKQPVQGMPGGPQKQPQTRPPMAPPPGGQPSGTPTTAPGVM